MREVPETAGDAAADLDDSVDGLGFAVARAVGVETGPAYVYDQVKQQLRLQSDRPTALREAIYACRKGGVSPAAAAIAWVLRRDSLCTIPKASSPQHLRDNATALEVELTREDLDALDRAFPPPSGPRPLEML